MKTLEQRKAELREKANLEILEEKDYDYCCLRGFDISAKDTARESLEIIEGQDSEILKLKEEVNFYKKQWYDAMDERQEEALKQITT